MCSALWLTCIGTAALWLHADGLTARTPVMVEMWVGQGAWCQLAGFQSIFSMELPPEQAQNHASKNSPLVSPVWLLSTQLQPHLWVPNRSGYQTSLHPINQRLFHCVFAPHAGVSPTVKQSPHLWSQTSHWCLPYTRNWTSENGGHIQPPGPSLPTPIGKAPLVPKD